MEVYIGLIGGIIVGICYCKAESSTRWFSRLGIVTMFGLGLIAWALFNGVRG